MHGFYRLNILRGFTISTLILVLATACLVIVTNFRDPDVCLPPSQLVLTTNPSPKYHDAFFASCLRVLLRGHEG